MYHELTTLTNHSSAILMVGYFQLGVFVKTSPLEQSHCLDASRFGVLEKNDLLAHHLSRCIYAELPLVHLCFTCLSHLSHILYFSRPTSKSTFSLMLSLMFPQDGRQ